MKYLLKSMQMARSTYYFELSKADQVAVRNHCLADEIKDIFVGMGFTVLDGPEVELATLNFDRLNAEEGHPSRDWSDTFYFDEDSRVMLRSQTSPSASSRPAACTGRTKWTQPILPCSIR